MGKASFPSDTITFKASTGGNGAGTSGDGGVGVSSVARGTIGDVRYPRNGVNFRTRVVFYGLESIQARGTHRDTEVAGTLRAHTPSPNKRAFC